VLPSMSSPIIRKIRRAKLSPLELALLIEKHVGTASNDVHCTQAIDALSRSNDHGISSTVQTICLVTKDLAPCDQLHAIVLHLRAHEGLSTNLSERRGAA